MRRNGKLKIWAKDIGESDSQESILFELSCGRKFWLSKRWLDLHVEDGVDVWYAPRFVLVSLNLH